MTAKKKPAKPAEFTTEPKKGGRGKRVCPECGNVQGVRSPKCEQCGHAFGKKAAALASDDPLMQALHLVDEVQVWLSTWEIDGNAILNACKQLGKIADGVGGLDRVRQIIYLADQLGSLDRIQAAVQMVVQRQPKPE